MLACVGKEVQKKGVKESWEPRKGLSFSVVSVYVAALVVCPRMEIGRDTWFTGELRFASSSVYIYHRSGATLTPLHLFIQCLCNADGDTAFNGASLRVREREENSKLDSFPR